MKFKLIQVFKGIILTASIITFIGIFFVSCFNYFKINNFVEEIIISQKDQKDQACINENENEIENEHKTRNFDREHNRRYKIDEHSKVTNALRTGIIDSNVLTFLYSFLFLFFGGFLFYIVNGAEKRIDEAKRQVENSNSVLKKLEVEREALNLYLQIMPLLVLSELMQNQLDSQKYKIDTSINLLNYRIYKLADGLLKKFKDDKFRHITKDLKEELGNIVLNIINGLQLETIKNLPENKSKFRTIEQTSIVIKAVQKEISRLKEIN